MGAGRPVLGIGLGMGVLGVLVVVLAEAGWAAGPTTTTTTRGGGTRRLLVLNDIHYQKFYTAARGAACHCLNYTPAPCAAPVGLHPHLAQLGCDSSEALLDLAVESAHALCPDPSVLLVLGDSAGHSLDRWQAVTQATAAEARQQALDMITIVADRINSQWPSTPRYFSIGNDDTFPDYDVATRAYHARLMRVWGASLQTEAARTTFAAGGYYRADVPGSPVSILVLATNVFFKTANCSAASPAMQVLAWLDRELAAIRTAGRRAWVAGHIPPGYNDYPTQEVLKEYWAQCYGDRYQGLLTTYRGVVLEQLFAHEHRALYEGLSSPTAVPLRVHPAVSPIYLNNPGFRCYTLDSGTDEVVDYTDFFLNLSSPDPPAFVPYFRAATTEYAFPSLAAPAEYDLVQAMQRSTAVFARYWRNAMLGQTNPVCHTPGGGLDPECVSREICAMESLTEAEYTACRSRRPAPPAGPDGGSRHALSAGAIAGIAIGLAAVLVGGGALIVRHVRASAALYDNVPLRARLIDGGGEDQV